MINPMLKSALVLGEFIATVGLAAGLIIADAVLLSYGIARLIDWMINKASDTKPETVTVLGYDEPGDWGAPRKMKHEPKHKRNQ